MKQVSLSERLERAIRAGNVTELAELTKEIESQKRQTSQDKVTTVCDGIKQAAERKTNAEKERDALMFLREERLEIYSRKMDEAYQAKDDLNKVDFAIAITDSHIESARELIRELNKELDSLIKATKDKLLGES